MIIYASVNELDSWLPAGTAQPPNAAELLRSASFRVARACMRNPYHDTPNVTDAEPLRDATLAQVALWATLGISPATGALDVPAPIKKSTMLGADVERDTSGQAAARLTAANELCEESVAILTAAGLYSLDLPVWTEPDSLPLYGLGWTRSIGYTAIDETSPGLPPGVIIG